MGIDPGVIHMNEGHSAFAVLEEIRRRMDFESIDFEEAALRVSDATVFTTHTPVPAGHDRFDAHLIEEHLGPIGDEIGLDLNGLMALGRVNTDDPGEEFCMTVLGTKVLATGQRGVVATRRCVTSNVAVAMAATVARRGSDWTCDQRCACADVAGTADASAL